MQPSFYCDTLLVYRTAGHNPTERAPSAHASSNVLEVLKWAGARARQSLQPAPPWYASTRQDTHQMREV